jgi:hypothetical protein
MKKPSGRFDHDGPGKHGFSVIDDGGGPAHLDSDGSFDSEAGIFVPLKIQSLAAGRGYTDCAGTESGNRALSAVHSMFLVDNNELGEVLIGHSLDDNPVADSDIGEGGCPADFPDLAEEDFISVNRRLGRGFVLEAGRS